jgi:Flp pilus assembly protein TadG
MRRIFGKSRGQMMVLITASLVSLIAMAGVVVDVGLLYVTRRQMQTAADAAAVAGANALQGTSTVSAGYVTAAKDAAGNNGFTDGVNSVSVAATQVSCPGAAGQQCVQANVSQPVPVYFLRVLALVTGQSYTTVSVSTKAIAGGVNSPACIYALDPSASKSLTVNGSVGLTSACGILVDSNDSEGIYGGGSAAVTASAIGVQGGYSVTSGWSPTPISGIAPAPDPLASFVEPSLPSTCDVIGYKQTKSDTLTHGTYCGGMTISGTGTITFGPGLYILVGGGMKVTGNPVLNGTGVTFYNTAGTVGGTSYSYVGINLAGGGLVTLTAPTTGTYQGMLFLADRTVAGTSDFVTGGSGSVFDGVLYFPKSQLTYAGNSNTSGSCAVANAGYTELIGDTLTFSGSSTLDICDDFSTLGGKDPLSSNTFYE